MARRCSICSHAELATINRSITSGASLRDVARQFGVSRSALHRHASDHLTEVLAAAAEAQAATTIKLGTDLLATQREVLQAVLDVLNEGQRTCNHAMVLAAAKTATPIMERLSALAPPRASPFERHERAVKIGQRLREMLTARGADMANSATRARLLNLIRDEAPISSPALPLPTAAAIK